MSMPSRKSLPIVIVDIDGTICDSSERLKRVGFDPTKPRSEWPTEWGSYTEDSPIDNMIELVNNLYENYRIIIVTVRDASTTYQTMAWLEHAGVCYDGAYCLGVGTENLLNKSPADLKEDFLKCLTLEQTMDGAMQKVAFALEDSPSMVEMFRRNGITCLDVGPFYGSM